MILFKPEHVPLILAGTKTQTRRLAHQHETRPRWKIGGLHRCYTRPPFARGGAEPFASIQIRTVILEKLGDISTEDVIREGYTSHCRYIEAFERINRREFKLDTPVWVIDFQLVTPTQPSCGGDGVGV